MQIILIIRTPRYTASFMHFNVCLIAYYCGNFILGFPLSLGPYPGMSYILAWIYFTL